MSNAPWFRFFAADYMSSPFVQSLDPEQELWYVRLIIASANNLPRGCLPLANGKLWRLAKAPSLEHFEKHASQILAKFERDDAAGVYRVPKVAEQQLVTRAELSGKRSEAGRKGAAKRWQTDSKLPSASMANEKQKIADSDSDSDTDNKTSSEQSSDGIEIPSQKKPAKEPSKEASRLAALLKSEILCNKADYRITPAQERKWTVTAQRMIDIDKRDPQKIADLIRWVQHDEFEMSNVLSMDKLRKRFDQLELKRGNGKVNGKIPPLSPSEIARRQQEGREWRQ